MTLAPQSTVQISTVRISHQTLVSLSLFGSDKTLPKWNEAEDRANFRA